MKNTLDRKHIITIKSGKLIGIDILRGRKKMGPLIRSIMNKRKFLHISLRNLMLKILRAAEEKGKKKDG